MRLATRVGGFAAPRPDYSTPDVPPRDARGRLRRPNLAINDLPVRIGADSNGGSRFIGDIADVRIYKRALTAEEIAAAAKQQAPPADEPSLVAAWSFGRLQDGGFFADAGSRLKAKTVGDLQVIAGPAGNAIHLDGKGHPEIADNPARSSEAVTLAARVSPGKSRKAAAESLTSRKSARPTAIRWTRTPAIRCVWPLCRPAPFRKTMPFVPGQWVHVAATVQRGRACSPPGSRQPAGRR